MPNAFPKFLCRVLGLSLAFAAISLSAAPAKNLVFFGDSITAGYGLNDPATDAYPAVIQQKIDAAHLGWHVVNAGLSGETTAGGLRRVDWILRQPIDLFVLALGGNDGLRGNPLEETRRNLIAIVEACRKAGAKVVIAGMRIPPNYGPVYARRFEGLFAEVARQQNVSLVPFMLQGFTDDRAMFQADGMHPGAGAQPRILDNIYHRLRPLLLPRPRRGNA